MTAPTGGRGGDGGGRRGLGYDDDDDDFDMKAVRRHFREFLRNYRLGPNNYVYRNRLLRMYRRTSGDEYSNSAHNTGPKSSPPPEASVEVDVAHLGEYDPAMMGLLQSRPSDAMPTFEAAAGDALRTLLFDERRRQNGGGGGGGGEGADGEGEGAGSQGGAGGTQDAGEGAEGGAAGNFDDDDDVLGDGGFSSVQILLRGDLSPTPLRSIRSKHMNTLLRVPGITISASRVRSRAHAVAVRCGRCGDARTIRATSGPFGGVPIPQRCGGPNPSDCGPAPYATVPDDCSFVDQQTLKLQESPEMIPMGEMPRSVLLAVERGLVDLAPPGTRVSVLAVPSLFSAGGGAGNNSGGNNRTVYLRVLGLQRDAGAGESVTFTPREEEAFRLLSRRPDVYDILSRSIAPSISGDYTVDIKRALVCMLFGGSRKRLPDGMRLRGDINVLLLGDPSMAKSQFLKYTTRCAPVGVYTSGKGSSAAGLTASVVRDARGEFYLEGGAMVLADGGVVGIDEFDKMRPQDRVAIHEAMEQQTISVAKAGITTVLNSRTSVLAAANPVFGRYDDLKSAGENIDLMTTILSRFDLIFLVRDVRNEDLDRMICRHVMGVHMSASGGSGGKGGGGGLGGLAASNAAGGAGGGGIGDGDEDGGFAAGDTGGGGGASGPDSDKSSPEAIAENASRIAATGKGELEVPTIKKYVQYCKSRCVPRLGEDAGDVLSSNYVRIRDDVRKRAIATAGEDGGGGSDQAAIPITVRQLEALVRISESLAKMRLETEVRREDVAEALRLFRVSTMAANAADDRGGAAAAAGSVPHTGGAGGGAIPSREEMLRAESFLKSRLVVGAVVNKQRIVEEAAGRGYNAPVMARAMAVMAMRGEVQERNQGRLIRRVR